MSFRDDDDYNDQPPDPWNEPKGEYDWRMNDCPGAGNN